MKSYFACLLIFLALHVPAQAQSLAPGQVVSAPAPVENETVLRNLGE